MSELFYNYKARIDIAGLQYLLGSGYISESSFEESVSNEINRYSHTLKFEKITPHQLKEMVPNDSKLDKLLETFFRDEKIDLIISK